MMREIPPLHCVGGMGGGEDDKEVIKLLLKAGANINLVNREGDTPLSSYDLRSSHLIPIPAIQATNRQ